MADINNRLSYDSLGSPIQIANTFRTYDAAGTAVESPLSMLTATEQLITVPENAISINIYSDQLLKIGHTSADVGGTGNGYSFVAASSWMNRGIAGIDSFYIRNDSGSTATVQFDFVMI